MKPITVRSKRVLPLRRTPSPLARRQAAPRRSAAITPVLLCPVLLCWMLCCTPALGWNPYDTDSARGRDDAQPWTDRGASDNPSSAAWGDGASGWAGRGAGAPGFGTPGFDAPGFDALEQSAPGFNDPWAARVRPRYRFRGDAAADGGSGWGGAPAGLRYRPLTERERERQAPAAEHPGYRPRDLQPRGPSWRLEDEGSAFGYHPDYQRFNEIAPPLPR